MIIDGFELWEETLILNLVGMKPTTLNRPGVYAILNGAEQAREWDAELHSKPLPFPLLKIGELSLLASMF